jgi:RNA polymerase sigma-70 factor (ECF subfamily)
VSEDRQLIAECLGGNHAAYGELVARYQDKLYNCLRYLFGCPDMSRAVVEKAFVETFERLAECVGDRGFAGQLYRIALLDCLSRPVPDGDGRQQAVAEHNGAPHLAAAEEQSKLPLEQMLAGLERLDRAVLVLREVDGYCYETIGQILDRPVEEVRSRLARARVRLRASVPKSEIGQPVSRAAAPAP